MSDLNDLSRPVLTDTEPNVLDTLRAHIVRAATWAGYAATVNKVAGIMSGVTAAISGGRSLRLYRRNDANTADEEVVSLPGVSVGGNAATASAAQVGGALQAALDAKAPLASPALTGTPTAPTATAGTATTQLANTAFVAAAVANVVNSSPAALDTLNELAAALGNDPNFAASTATALGNRITKTSAARPGVTKLYRSDLDDAYNLQTAWGVDKSGYWSLRGYNGDTYHAPVYVGFAGAADAVPWSGVSGKPNTVAGYGITDMGSQSVNYANSAPWSGVTGKPSTLSGYGISDAQPLTNATGVGAIIFGVYRTYSGGSPANGSYTDYPIGRLVSGIYPAAIWQVTDRVNLMMDAYSALPGTWKFQCGMANSFGHSWAVMNNNASHAVFGLFQRVA